MLLPIFIIQVLLFQLAVGQHTVFKDLDLDDDLSEEEFLKNFALKKPISPVEYARRKKALKANEKIIHDVNVKFMKGELSWFDKVNEFSDLPEDEFVKGHTGAKFNTNIVEGRGLIAPLPENLVDPASEVYFDSIMMNRGSAPASYSAVDKGLVSPVKSQYNCGSCVAFAQGALTETCFKKVTGKFTDVSEQYFLDCGYLKNEANGCDGAELYSYAKTWAEEKLDLAHEGQLGYKDEDQDYECPANLAGFKFGAKITESYYKHVGATEDLLKELVFKHGAVMSAVAVDQAFKDYKGGVYAGCGANPQKNHAIVVVGYGTDENGLDYWLIKNSWGQDWGEKGYMRLQRGKKMCGIGQDIAATICSAVSGPTEKPPAIEKPCIDVYSDCAEMAETSCFRPQINAKCRKSCGLCKGMTPVESNTCYDASSRCSAYAEYCDDPNNPQIKSQCKITCGSC